MSNDAPAPVEEKLPKDESKPPESLSKIIDSLGPIAPLVHRAFVVNGWQATIQISLCAIGGGAVLGLAYVAAWRGQWDVVEKIAIPVLAFFGGLVAGRSKD